ncbi:hypothetical protein EVAR_94409_1 [Eumeta japonica]|uniref:Uncharacterized protein n=1 Tax=Eumeta variegata TaxID=151549 RepID=A0A4C1TQ19_EUMVA|nr:hypothetical protein EVAR_94409_1 [Eumeta japonica]
MTAGVCRAGVTELKLVFPTGDGMAVSHPVRLPGRRRHPARMLTLSRGDKAEAKLRLARRCVLAAFAGALTGGDRCPSGHVRYGIFVVPKKVPDRDFGRLSNRADNTAETFVSQHILLSHTTQR